MGILPYKVLCNAALCAFHISLLKVALLKVFDPDIQMKGKSGAVVCCSTVSWVQNGYSAYGRRCSSQT